MNLTKTGANTRRVTVKQHAQSLIKNKHKCEKMRQSG